MKFKAITAWGGAMDLHRSMDAAVKELSLQLP